MGGGGYRIQQRRGFVRKSLLGDVRRSNVLKAGETWMT